MLQTLALLPRHFLMHLLARPGLFILDVQSFLALGLILLLPLDQRKQQVDKRGAVNRIFLRGLLRTGSDYDEFLHILVPNG